MSRGGVLDMYLDEFPNRKVAVIGDLVLDVYLFGTVDRISREAPVPIVDVARRTTSPGGAANGVRNIATLGAHGHLFGVVGNDAAGDELMTQLRQQGVDVSGVVRDPSRCTTEKRRVMASGQQLLRVDYEDRADVDDMIRHRIVESVKRLMRSHEIDAVIFENYRKGVLAKWMVEEIVAEAKRTNIVTALDPKPDSIAPVKGLTVMKPNRNEAFALAELADRHEPINPKYDANLRAVADRLLSDWEPEYLLISLAEMGMALFGKDGSAEYIPTRAREVYDVSGAGDTVTATFTLALVAGATPVQAAELANLAAGIVVGKIGTAPVYLEELKRSLA